MYDNTVTLQVVNTISSRSRPHSVHTHMSADDLALCQPVAIHVQHYDTEALAPGTLAVYAESDTEWVEPTRLAPIEALMKRMQRWTESTPCRDNANIVVLSGQELARPIFGLEDERCPVLTLSQELLDRGWTRAKGLVTHRDPADHTFDGRFATRMRWYFRALFHGLETCMPLAGGAMPSQHPVAFYRLLVAGVAVGPGLRAKEYMAMLNDRRRRQGLAALALPPHEADPPLPAPGNDGVIVLPALGAADLPAPRRLGGRGAAGAGRGRGAAPVPACSPG